MKGMNAFEEIATGMLFVKNDGGIEPDVVVWSPGSSSIPYIAEA